MMRNTKHLELLAMPAQCSNATVFFAGMSLGYAEVPERDGKSVLSPYTDFYTRPLQLSTDMVNRDTSVPDTS